MNGSRTSGLLRLSEMWTIGCSKFTFDWKSGSGPISPKELSGSVKTIMLMLFDETGMNI